MDKQQMTPQQAIGFLASVIKSGEPFTEQCEQAVAIAMAALSHAVDDTPFAYCFTDVNGRPSELTGPPEHAAPEDKRVITALFKRPAPQVAVPWPKREDITEDMRAGFERLYREKAEREGRTLEPNEQGAYAHLTVDADWIFYQRAWADALEATAPQQAVPEKVRELIGAVRSVNRSRQHSIHIEGDDEPCFWQRAEWVRYVLELADEAEQTITVAPTAPVGEQDPLPVGLSLRPLTDLIHEMDELCRITPVDFEAAVDMGYVDGAQDLHDKIIAECRRLAGMKRQQPVSDPYKLPDRVLMPRSLTAENGAKTALMGEFDFSVTMTCPECHPDEPNPDCDVCGGSVEYEQAHTVPWTTIKRIYATAVDLLASPALDDREIAAPQEPLHEIADALDCFWNAAVGAAHGNETVGAIGQGLSAVAERLRGHELGRLHTRKVKCDGNHGGPRCADPECWIDDETFQVPGLRYVPPVELSGVDWAADGDANFYTVFRNGNWLAKVQFNGEVPVQQQDSLLTAWLGKTGEPDHG